MRHNGKERVIVTGCPHIKWDADLALDFSLRLSISCRSGKLDSGRNTWRTFPSSLQCCRHPSSWSGAWLHRSVGSSKWARGGARMSTFLGILGDPLRWMVDRRQLSTLLLTLRTCLDPMGSNILWITRSDWKRDLETHRGILGLLGKSGVKILARNFKVL